MPLKRSLIASAIAGYGEFAKDPLYVRPLLAEFKKEDEGNSSLDLRLGRWFLTLQESNAPLLDFSKENRRSDSQLARKHFVRFDSQFILHPGRFVLGATLEWVRMPHNCAGSIVGKSSLGRHGLIIETAPVVHPGFSGCLTLELTNVGEIPIALLPGMEIAQLQIEKAQGDGEGVGRFKGFRRPILGATKTDRILARLRSAQPK